MVFFSFLLFFSDSDFREKSIYCYENITNGNIQSEYPAPADDEMDISTTPPHEIETPTFGNFFELFVLAEVMTNIFMLSDSVCASSEPTTAEQVTLKQ